MKHYCLHMKLGDNKYSEHENKRRLLEHWDATRRFWRVLDAFIVDGMVHVVCNTHGPFSLFSPHLVHKLNVDCKNIRCDRDRDLSLCPGCMERVGDNRVLVHRPNAAPVFNLYDCVRYYNRGGGVQLLNGGRSLGALGLCNDCINRFEATVPDTPKLQKKLGLVLSSISGLVQHVLAYLCAPRPTSVCFECNNDI